MRLDRLTSKFQIAISDAQSLALGRDHQFIEPIHLMLALLNQEGGSIRPLLTLAGATIPPAMQGTDLAVPMAQRSESDKMAYAEEDHEGNVLRSIRTDTWKLIEANPGNPRGLPATELFAIGSDPKEKQNVVDQNAAVTAEMRQHAEAQRQLAASQAVESGAQVKLTKEECEKLRVLGYVQDCDTVN